MVFRTQLSYLSHIPLTPRFYFFFFFLFSFILTLISRFFFFFFFLNLLFFILKNKKLLLLKNHYYSTSLTLLSLPHSTHPTFLLFTFFFFSLSRLLCFYLKRERDFFWEKRKRKWKKKRDLSISFVPFYLYNLYILREFRKLVMTSKNVRNIPNLIR